MPALHAALVLRRCLISGLGWHDDPVSAVRQLDNIGPVSAIKLRDGGAGSLEALCQQVPSHLEALCSKGSPFGASLLRNARALLALAPTLAHRRPC